MATNMFAFRCFCNVPAEETVVKRKNEDKILFMCGTVVNYGHPKTLGCNFSLSEEDAKIVWKTIGDSTRFSSKEYGLDKEHMSFEEEWPKCGTHELYVTVKVAKNNENGNAMRPLFSCSAPRPNDQCKFFKWVEDVFSTPRENDVVFMKAKRFRREYWKKLLLKEEEEEEKKEQEALEKESKRKNEDEDDMQRKKTKRVRPSIGFTAALMPPRKEPLAETFGGIPNRGGLF